jgi:hypothetical protein
MISSGDEARLLNRRERLMASTESEPVEADEFSEHPVRQ